MLLIPVPEILHIYIYIYMCCPPPPPPPATPHPHLYAPTFYQTVQRLSFRNSDAAQTSRGSPRRWPLIPHSVAERHGMPADLEPETSFRVECHFDHCQLQLLQATEDMKDLAASRGRGQSPLTLTPLNKFLRDTRSSFVNISALGLGRDVEALRF